MSCIFKIKEGFNSYTETEKRLAEYILENKDEVINFSAQELGESVNSSAAAVIRFSKKLGYKGYTSLKVDLAKDKDEDIENFDEIIREDDSIEMLIKKSINSNIRTINETANLINSTQLEYAINALIHCNNIYLFGVGSSGVICNDFLHKLSRINRNVIHHDDVHIMLSTSAHINANDVAIAISYSGNTKEINIAMKHAKSVGAACIAITKFNNKSQLSKIADIILHIPNEEKSLRLGAVSSRNSSLMITDILYYGVAKAKIDNTIKDIVKTRNLIDELK